MTDSPGFDISMMELVMTNTTESQIQTEMEYQIVSEKFKCSFYGGDPLIMFLVGGIGMSIVSLIGIVGNILGRLSKRQIRFWKINLVRLRKEKVQTIQSW